MCTKTDRHVKAEKTVHLAIVVLLGCTVLVPQLLDVGLLALNAQLERTHLPVFLGQPCLHSKCGN